MLNSRNEVELKQHSEIRCEFFKYSKHMDIIVVLQSNIPDFISRLFFHASRFH
jgi:hypothetical protein